MRGGGEHIWRRRAGLKHQQALGGAFRKMSPSIQGKKHTHTITIEAGQQDTERQRAGLGTTNIVAACRVRCGGRSVAVCHFHRAVLHEQQQLRRRLQVVGPNALHEEGQRVAGEGEQQRHSGHLALPAHLTPGGGFISAVIDAVAQSATTTTTMCKITGRMRAVRR